MASKTVIGFDLYGTLLSTESIAKQLAGLYGIEMGKGLAAQWRRYQLEYTWRANSMGTYRPFSEITRAALRHAIAEQQLTLPEADEARLMDAYNSLEPFPEVAAMMEAVAGDPSLDTYVFSNGTNDMVSASVRTAPVLSQTELFSSQSKLVTVESLGVKAFKPDPQVYMCFAETVGVKDIARLWVVSANPFDALGARVAGAQSAWIDRAGSGWVDALGGLLGKEPTIIVKGVDEAVREIAVRSKQLF